MSDISDFCISLSSALSGTVDEYVSENRCKTLPPYPVVPLQERNDMSELQMDLCRWSCWANTEPASVQFSHSVVSDSLRPHESQHARPPCPSPTPGVYSNPCPAYVWGKGKAEQGEIVPSLQFTRNRIFANHTYPNCSLSQFYLSYYLYDSQGCYLLTVWSWAHFLTFLCLSFFIHEMGIIIVPTFLG